MNKKNKNKILLNLLDHISTRVLIGLIIGSIAIIAVVILIFWLANSNSLSIGNKERLVITQAQIESIEAIQQWEFLSISDEELVDTTRYGFFGDDHLVRIYYGTLRLGIDLSKTEEGWLSLDKDTIVALLPPVTLLDDDFIDETRTRSFYEEGTWSQQDRTALYQKAKRMMKQRCLTEENYRSAERQATAQFNNLLHSMGFEFVRVRFKE